VLVAWLLAWWHLAADWSVDEQYRFGFGVPFLAAWMAWRRFEGPMKPAPPRFGWWCGIAFALVLLTLGNALRWHDPQWRFTGAALAAGAALLGISWLHRIGGGPLIRRQLFPLLFAMTAVPWPVPVEIWTIGHLAGAVTDVAVTAVNMLGVAALQHGNTIELAKGVVGVDDACSGIQSLQATLMTALFLGEFFALRTAGRIALVAAGGCISFLTNCGRVLSLTMLAHSRGTQGAMEWHDAVGGTATASALGLVLAAALLLRRDPPAAPPASSRTAPIAMPEGIAIFTIVLAIPLAALAWFSRFENSGTPADRPVAWVLSDSHLPAGWKATFLAAPKTIHTALRFSEWQSFHVRNPEGMAAQVIRLAWKPGTRLPSFVTNHTPAVCMPSAGWQSSDPPFLLTLTIHGADLPCAAYPFARDGARLIALQSLSAGGRPESRLVDPAQIPGTLRRLATLWEAPLRQITGELLLYLPDPGDEAARKAAATSVLEAVLLRKNP
jgi:exosortase